MKIKDYINTYQEFSGKASELNRQLLFSAIAIIWIFNVTSDTDKFNLPKELLNPLITISVGLLLDFLQYFVASIIWYNFYRKHEKIGTSDAEDIKSPVCLTTIISFFYYGKIIAMLVSYYFIISYLISEI